MNKRNIDRRTGPDSLLKLTGVISSMSWGIFSVVIIFLWVLIFFIYIFTQVADPMKGILDQQGNPLLNSLNTPVALINYSFYLMLLIFIVSSIGLIVNASRHHRSTDTYSKPLVALFLLSLISVILYLIFIKY